MASVTSLDQDMRNLRLGRYTPQAANEARQWIEDSLGESLSSHDLLDALKDGIVLCKLANLVLPPPGVKFKTMAMPFIQMENISHFLKACEMPPLNLPAHDRFLTVDLYEQKDPAQVLQCLGAFSRQAHAARPDRWTEQQRRELEREREQQTGQPDEERDESFGCRAIVVTRDEPKLHGWLHWLRGQHTIYHEVARACEQLE
ncbi:hypothetical protein KC324_g20927 [Hortaea werneckii]|nr:hypothetical protein KC355_g7889 [Hortaea werneckii]KAI7101923.1 hypothetical protein KC324_g20927 [Hortaea werneckii]